MPATPSRVLAQQRKAGKLTKAEEERIDRKADKKLEELSGRPPGPAASQSFFNILWALRRILS